MEVLLFTFDILTSRGFKVTGKRHNLTLTSGKVLESITMI